MMIEGNDVVKRIEKRGTPKRPTRRRRKKYKKCLGCGHDVAHFEVYGEKMLLHVVPGVVMTDVLERIQDGRIRCPVNGCNCDNPHLESDRVAG